MYSHRIVTRKEHREQYFSSTGRLSVIWNTHKTVRVSSLKMVYIDLHLYLR